MYINHFQKALKFINLCFLCMNLIKFDFAQIISIYILRILVLLNFT